MDAYERLFDKLAEEHINYALDMYGRPLLALGSKDKFVRVSFLPANSTKPAEYSVCLEQVGQADKVWTVATLDSVISTYWDIVNKIKKSDNLR